MRLPPDRRYSRSHAWAMTGGPGDVRSGLTTCRERSSGTSSPSSFLPRGRRYPPGADRAGRIHHHRVRTSVPPFRDRGRREPGDGERPAEVTEDPYGEGWLLSIRPAAREELDGLLTAEEYVRFVGETLE